MPQEIFNRFNRQIFNNELLPVKFIYVNARTFVGQFCHPVNSRLPKEKLAGRCTIKISRLFKLSESQLEDIIIHEMIHYYIWIKGIRQISPHDEVFLTMMNRINRTFNRNITVSQKSGSEGVDLTDPRRKTHILCITEWKHMPGKIFITPSARTSFVGIDKAFRADRNLIRLQWYVSTDVWFNKLRTFRTPKAILITPEDYERYVLSKSTPYLLKGTTLIKASEK